VQGWYKDKEYTQPWNFFIDTVEEDITLYAKWVKNYEVTYYLGDETDVPMYKQYVQEGQFITDYEKLAHGYESNGFYTNARHTEEFDFTKPITSDVNVYIHRSDYFYFSGEMLATRNDLCYMMAAPSGSGSTPGTIELKEDAETNEKYAEINFGYSTAADPYLHIRNMAIDISASQKVEITFRNIGKATSLKFYYVVQMADGTFTDGEWAHEGNAFLYKYEADEKNMDPNGEWVTKVLDFSSILTNGVSNWGISSVMTQLRIQSGYVCEDENDLSNILQIKSIRGIPDDTYTSQDDSENVSILRVDDDATDVQEVANAQEDVCGWVFPKDFASARTSNGEIYEKTSGLLFYSPFRAKKTSLALGIPQLADGTKEKIDLSKKTTIRIRLTNYGYANKFTLNYKNKVGRGSNVDVAIAPCVGEPTMKEYVLNMYGSRLYEGLLENLSIEYDSIGINNAIMIHSIEFLDFERMDIPGISFNDMYAGDATVEDYWTNINNAAISYTGSGLTTGATKIEVGNGGYLEKACNMTNFGYESMTLKYMDEEGVRNVIVALTIAGEETEYIYDLMSEEVSKYMGWNVLTLPLTATGQVEKVKVRFIGEGSITIQEIRFNMAERSGVDFSNSETTGTINTQKWDGGIISYNNALSAAAISAQYNEANHEVSTVRYYFDALLKYYNQGEGNMDITGKSKLIIVYNNLGDLNRLNVGLGTVDVTEDDSWKTAHMEIGNSGGFINNISIKSNMAKGEWATIEIDLTQYNTLKNGTDGKAINEIGIQQGYNESAGTITVSDETIYIRAIIVM
ncbi:MAG: InlB B-repeat-containing protein, partial [Clostridia bacterium]|nr:InlB B-repeat-containing protein [Clostridia bacterium]